jgi:hypothetical protein
MCAGAGLSVTKGQRMMVRVKRARAASSRVAPQDTFNPVPANKSFVGAVFLLKKSFLKGWQNHGKDPVQNLSE